MAKKKRPQRGNPQRRTPVSRSFEVPEARVVHAPETPAPAPAFWFGFEVPWAKLCTARVVLFGLLAIDAVLQLRHAPRYGATDFNVAQLSFLDGLGAGRLAYGACQVALALLFTSAALGVATRFVLPIATALYAWLYFGSQLDSYQHHYMIALVLAVSCFVPWQPRQAVVRSWAIRLILVEMGIVYLWAAVSKLDPVWLDGTALDSQITGSMRSLILGTVGFKVAAITVVVVELFLAFAVWLRPAWKLAAPIGLGLHLGILATGFEIGLFVYDMLALYILVIPDRIWRAASEIGIFAKLGALGRAIVNSAGPPMLGLAVLAGVPIALLCRLPHVFPLALIALGVALIAMVRSQIKQQRPTAAAPLVVLVGLVLVFAVDRSTTVAIDYYRFWGGSQRRIGDVAQAEQAYRGMLGIEPHSEIAHFYLGRILIQTDRASEGLEHLHAAQRDEPGRARAFVEEARYLVTVGRKPEAIAKAKDAVFADPSDSDAKALFDTLQGTAKPAGPKRPDPDDD